MNTLLHARGLQLDGLFSDLDLSIAAGDCLAVLGPNGCGKSSLLAVLAGALIPDRGTVEGPADLGYLPENCPLDPGLTGAQWLAAVSRRHAWDAAFAQAILHRLPVPLDRRAELLSMGERTRLGLLLTLPRKAPVLLLDDPFLGLDPAARAAAESLIAQRSDPDTALLFATPDAPATLRLCTHLGLLGKGTWTCLPRESWEAHAAATGPGGLLAYLETPTIE
jgi:ABC-2 type transport system ATP-binding protein